ncbi:UNVERIFIED_ORG: hypothetical protein GGE63_006453 [Rhizobium esperanzae]
MRHAGRTFSEITPPTVIPGSPQPPSFQALSLESIAAAAGPAWVLGSSPRTAEGGVSFVANPEVAVRKQRRCASS